MIKRSSKFKFLENTVHLIRKSDFLRKKWEEILKTDNLDICHIVLIQSIFTSSKFTKKLFESILGFGKEGTKVPGIYVKPNYSEKWQDRQVQ